MADDNPDTRAGQDEQGVRLVSSEGHETTVRSPEAVNNLVYGRGYRLAGDSDPEAAVQAAQDQATQEQPAQERAGDGEASGQQTQAPSVPEGTSTTTAPKAAPRGGKATPPSTT